MGTICGQEDLQHWVCDTGAGYMHFWQASKIRLIMAAGLLALVTACSATFQNHGYVPTDGELENVLVGVDTRATVAEVIGRPSSTGVLENSGWYYISTRIRNFAYRKPEVIDRQLLAITFDQKGVVANIERFGLDHGRAITLSRRVTSTGIKGPGILKQILGNFGNLNAGDFIPEG